MAKKDVAKNKVIQAFNTSKDSRQPREPVWNELYQIYRAYTEEREDGKSNLFIPYLFSVVETVVPRLTDTIFAQRPYVKPLPRETSDIESAEALEVLLDYQFERTGFKRKATDWFKEACIYGHGIVKVIWKTETKNVKQKVPIDMSTPLNIFKILMGDIKNPDGMAMTKEVKQEVTSYDGPDIELVDIFDFYPDPYCSSLEDARYVIHRSLKPFKHIKDMVKQGIYKGDLNEIRKSQRPDIDNENSYMKRQENIGMATEPTDDTGMYEILEYWEEDRVITLVNRTFVVRDTDNPYNHKMIPFVDVVDTKVPAEFWGIGEIEPNKRLQHEMNTIRNQRVDIVSGSINNMWAYLEGFIDPDDLISAPNGLIPIKNTGNKSLGEVLIQLGPQRVSPAAFTEEETIKKNIQETSGVTQYVQGIQPSGQATATEITSLQREANYRFKQKIMNMIEGIEKVGQLFVALNQQFMDQEQYIRISGERQRQLQYQQPIEGGQDFNFLSVSPENILGQFDVKVSSTSLEPLADKQVKRQQLLEVFQVLAQQGMPSMELTKEILKTYDIPALDRVIAELNQLQQQQQQMAMMEAQGGMPPEQQAPVGQAPPNPQMNVPRNGGMGV